MQRSTQLPAPTTALTLHNDNTAPETRQLLQNLLNKSSSTQNNLAVVCIGAASAARSKQSFCCVGLKSSISGHHEHCHHQHMQPDACRSASRCTASAIFKEVHEGRGAHPLVSHTRTNGVCCSRGNQQHVYHLMSSLSTRPVSLYGHCH